VEGVARFYGHHGGRQYGYQDSERPKPGDTTFDPASVKTKEGLIGQDVYDRRHRAFQQPQAREDRHAANYENDTSEGWLRGAHGRSDCYNEDATHRPNFDHSPPRDKMRR
jgi:hypothetical protein